MSASARANASARCDPPAEGARPAWVVIPARDEEAHIARALSALDCAARESPGAVHVVVVDDRSRDRTAERVIAALIGWSHGAARLLRGPAAGVGWARRTGLDHAVAAALASGAPHALVATTDADSRVPSHWLAALHDRLDEGHEVVAGDIHLEHSADLRLAEARNRRLAARLAHVRRRDPAAAHPHFAGANLALTARALHALAPIPAPQTREDDALAARCEALGLAILRDASFPVTTSARFAGRAADGLAAALRTDAEALGLA